MVALTGSDQIAEQILNELWMEDDADCPSVNQLNEVVNQLSNNTNQVGFGNSHINQKVVGPFFDASRDANGTMSPTACDIRSATLGLLQVGVPDLIIEAVLAEVIDPNGRLMTSMIFNQPQQMATGWCAIQ